MAASDDNEYTTTGAVPDYLIRHTTLRQIQVFEAIVRNGSYTRAAEELFLSQPTLSMQIKKLTGVLGLPLFEHVGRNVEPTEAGLALYKSSRELFELLSNLDMTIADLKGLKVGRLRMGVVTTAKYLAPELLGEFSRQYPGIDLALKVTNRERVIERMHRNEDDLYIMGQAPDDEMEVEAFPVAPNPLVVMAPRDHPLVGKKNIPLSEIIEQPFIMREPGSGIRNAVLRLFSRQKLRPQVRMELGSNEAIKCAVVGGLGLSVLSLHTLSLEGTDGPVAILDVEQFPIHRQWYIVHPKGKELSLVARTFLEFAIASETRIRERMVLKWPLLMQDIKDGRKTASRKKKTARKSQRS